MSSAWALEVGPDRELKAPIHATAVAAAGDTVDGSTTSGLSAGSGNLGGPTVICDNNGASYFDDTMFEVGLWDSGFSAGDLSSMNTNIHNTWGF